MQKVRETQNFWIKLLVQEATSNIWAIKFSWGMTRILCKRVSSIAGSDLGTQLRNETEQPSNLELAWSTSWQYS